MKYSTMASIEHVFDFVNITFEHFYENLLHYDFAKNVLQNREVWIKRQSSQTKGRKNNGNHNGQNK